jgi:hypothetical protein
METNISGKEIDLNQNKLVFWIQFVTSFYFKTIFEPLL